MLRAFSAQGGPEGLRAVAQRHHDTLEDACTRVIAAGMAEPGNVHHQSQFVWHAKLSDKSGEGFPQAGDGSRRAVTLSAGSHPGA
ncbi:MAG TPA: hypothetical protein VGS19_04030 [Streptosporangiaceae bacterium]|nr:hypothetical protein [Streptosporangiaceae bacterium]